MILRGRLYYEFEIRVNNFIDGWRQLEAKVRYVTCFFVRRSSLISGFALAAILIGCGRNERMDALYAQRCFNCHGPSGRGDGPLAASLPIPPPDFRDTVQRKSNPQIKRLITSGKGVMPAFEPALSPSEINDMLQMVRLLSREGRDISWWENFDALVAAHCSIPWEVVLGYDEPEQEKQR